jgi:hypothetical protein
LGLLEVGKTYLSHRRCQMDHVKAILAEALRDSRIRKCVLCDVAFIVIGNIIGISLLILALYTSNTVLLVGAISQMLVGLSLSSYVGRYLWFCHKVVKQEKRDEIDSN